MIYKLITWIEYIFRFSLQLLSGGVKSVLFSPAHVTFNSVNHRRNKLIYI